MTNALIVGFTADASDLEHSRLDVSALRAALARSDAEIEHAGHKVTRGWIDHDHETSLENLARILRSTTFDVVLVGAGVRGRPQFTELFERIVNTIHTLSPRARFAFNTDPASTLAAIERNI